MSLTREQALDMLRSDDLLGIGMEADAVRKRLHPEGVVTYSLTATSTTPTSAPSTARSAPSIAPWAAAQGYIQPLDSMFRKFEETMALGGTGVLMQGGLHPDLKIDYYEDLLRNIKQRFPQFTCTAFPRRRF